MFKSPAQRAAFFAAMKKKKAGLEQPTAKKPIELDTINAPKAPMEDIQSKLPKFAKVKKLFKTMK